MFCCTTAHCYPQVAARCRRALQLQRGAARYCVPPHAVARCCVQALQCRTQAASCRVLLRANARCAVARVGRAARCRALPPHAALTRAAIRSAALLRVQSARAALLRALPPHAALPRAAIPSAAFLNVQSARAALLRVYAASRAAARCPRTLRYLALLYRALFFCACNPRALRSCACRPRLAMPRSTPALCADARCYTERCAFACAIRTARCRAMPLRAVAARGSPIRPKSTRVSVVERAQAARGGLSQRSSLRQKPAVRCRSAQASRNARPLGGRAPSTTSSKKTQWGDRRYRPIYIYYIVPNGEKQQNEYDPRKTRHCVCGAPHYVMWIAPLCRCRAGLGLLCGVGRPTMSLPCRESRMLCFGCRCRAGVGLLSGVGRPTMSLPCKENHMLCLGVLVRNQHPTKHETNLQEVRVQSSIQHLYEPAQCTYKTQHFRRIC